MKPTILQEAIQEAERFLRAAKAAKAGEYSFGSNPSRAAAKRASLDLTRKLAELRRAPADAWFKS